MEVDLESDEEKSPDRVDLTSINLEFDPTAKCCCVARVSVMRVLLTILSGGTLVMGCFELSDAGKIKEDFQNAADANITEFVCVCLCACVRLCACVFAIVCGLILELWVSNANFILLYWAEPSTLKICS